MSRAADANVESSPDWLAGYNDPVVRPSGSDKKKMHEPDWQADQPLPNCDVKSREDTTWVVTERTALEPFYSPCGKPTCQNGLVDSGANEDESEKDEDELLESFHESGTPKQRLRIVDELADRRRGDQA